MKTFKEYISENNILNTSEFKQWFKDSEMIDKNDKPIIFYHGSNKDFNIFDKKFIGTNTDSGWLGEGFYFYTDINEASQYGKVKSYVLNIKNLYYATDEENQRLADLNNKRASKKFSDEIKSEGYDGIYYNGNLRGETVVFEPEQIREIKTDI